MHDLGRLGVPNTIWDKPGPLTPAERERVRLHAYLTERMLASSPALAPLAAIAVQHHERLDGIGLPARAAGGAISPGRAAPRRRRLLPGADSSRGPTARQAGRRGRRRAARRGAAGRIDGDAAEAVLAAAGHRVARRQAVAGRPDQPRGRGAAAARPGPVEQGDRARVW